MPIYELLQTKPGVAPVQSSQRKIKGPQLPSRTPVEWKIDHQRILETLLPAERNYRLHCGKLEFLALKWAVCEKFRDCLLYAPYFTIYTDNNHLIYDL